MKNLKLNMLMTFVLFSFSMQAQELSRSVFATSGETASNGNLQLSWTIGQSGLTGAFTEPYLSLNVGFQQFSDLSTYISETKNPGLLKVFPNPFHEDFNFSLKSENHGEITFYLYDNNGKIVLQKHSIPIAGGFCDEKIKLTNHPSGIYNLIFFFFPDNLSPVQFSIKLIKL